MIAESPKYLTCPWCNAQAFPLLKAEINIAPNVYLQRYECPAKHFFYIPEDTSFNYGYNKEDTCE